MMKNVICSMCLLIGVSMAGAQEKYPFQDSNLPIEKRVDDLVSRLTLSEKVQMMKHKSPAIERLGVPAYNWWNEALHGVARTSEKVTVFPQAIGLAATFDDEALEKSAEMISSEGRALFNEDLRAGKTGGPYRGLTYWTPNVNIFRDPRWGRGQETYGEDPYLTSKMGAAMVRGLEGSDPVYLKAVACAKHYAVHSGPEFNSMSNRTYRYFKGQVRYPFGYGLSYTTFQYKPCQTDTAKVTTGKTISFSAQVTNTGDRDGEEVVQLYISHAGNNVEPKPICALKGFKRIFLKKGETKEVTFSLTPEELALVNTEGLLMEKAGKADIYVGGGQPYKSEGVFYPLKIEGDDFQVY